jgi:Transposase domain (DUF772)
LNSEEQLELPEDLRAWLDEASLVRLVFEALHTVEEAEHRLGSTCLPPGPPRLLLTVLTYAYAIGLSGSEEIQRRIPADPQLRYLCAKTAPSASDLRGFRRRHRVLLLRSLSQLFKLAWISRARMLAWETAEWLSPLTDWSKEDLQRLLDGAAERRIGDAVLADTMALDC